MNLCEINTSTIKTQSEQELKKLAYQYNCNHGFQLSNEEKKRFAVEMIVNMTVEELSQVLSVSERTIRQWTEDKTKDLEEERNRLIINLYLKAENTQEKIAERLNVSQQTIANVVENFTKNGKIAEIGKNFNPYLYTIWSLPKQEFQSLF